MDFFSWITLIALVELQPQGPKKTPNPKIFWSDLFQSNNLFVTISFFIFIIAELEL